MNVGARSDSRAAARNVGLLLLSIALNLAVLLRYLFPLSERWATARQSIRYAVSEWLINYSGGFVRRGLVGEIVGRVADATGSAPHGVAMACGALVTGVVVGILAAALFRLRNALDPLRFAALAFSPLLLGFYLSDLQVLGRRDQLGLILTFLHLLILVAYARREDRRAGLSRYVRASGLLFLVLGTLAVLLHESVLFLSLPINLALTYSALREGCRERDARLWAAIYGPTLLVGAICLARHGDATVVARIENFWLARGEEPIYVSADGDQIATLAMSTGEALRGAPRFILHAGPVFLVLIAANHAVMRWALAALPWGGRKGRGLFDAFERRFLLWPFAASLPLYLVAVDWGRWLAILFAQYFLVAVWSEGLPFLRTTEPEASPRFGSALILAAVVSVAFRVPFLYAGWAGPPWGTLPRFLLAVTGRL